MTSFLDRLNLRPGERRLVVLVAVIIFILLNVWFIVPHFKDWKKIKSDHAKAVETLKTYRKEEASIPTNRIILKSLEEEGATVVQEDQVALRNVLQQASQHGVIVTGSRPIEKRGGTRTNEFFEEQSLQINVMTGEKQLVDFLYVLGEGSSMIRVRDMDLKPDAAQQKLMGTITMVASYLKKQAVAPTATNAAPTPAVRTNASGRPISTATKPGSTNRPTATNATRGAIPPPKKP